MATILLASKEIRTLPVSDSTGRDLSDDTVEVALVPYGTTPDDAEWVVCAWSQDTPGSVEVWLNLPGGFDLVALGGRGSYRGFVRVSDSPEVPVVRMTGELVVK